MPLYKIAGLVVDMPCTGRRLVRQAESYRIKTDVAPDIVLRVTEENIRSQAEQHPILSRDDWEYMLYGSIFYRKLLRFGGMMLHASAVAVGDYAYLFSANSGTGKSTHTQLWCRYLGERAFILNDDKPAVREEDGEFYVYGTPFSGKSDLNRNERIKLGGICFLSRSKANWIEPLAKEDAVPLMLEQTLRRLPMQNMTRLLEQMDRLLTAAPLWRMGCNMNLSAAEMAYLAMRRQP